MLRQFSRRGFVRKIHTTKASPLPYSSCPVSLLHPNLVVFCREKVIFHHKYVQLSGVERKGEVKCGHVRRRRSSLLPNDKLRNKARRTHAGRQGRHEETTETVRKTECNNSAATFPELFHATRAGPWRSRCPPRPLPPNFPLKAKQPTSCRIF